MRGRGSKRIASIVVWGRGGKKDSPGPDVRFCGVKKASPAANLRRASGGGKARMPHHATRRKKSWTTYHRQRDSSVGGKGKIRAHRSGRGRKAGAAVPAILPWSLQKKRKNQHRFSGRGKGRWATHLLPAVVKEKN